ncbi:MAG TPA: 3-deoxy-D-manno-octulosonic acid transferase [Pseudolabrys sp.]|nr:3-deoxy-D-manno-octulosonic acid transferase [Pseudolabrys sp.]
MTAPLPRALQAYRLALSAAAPLTPLLLRQRLVRGKEIDERLCERRGEGKLPRPDGPLVWLHAASVGEVMSVLPLIERISDRGLTMLVTSGTVTSSEIAAQRMPPGVIHQFVPLDVPSFVERFLDRWRPQLALFVESDLWPNLLIETARRDVPLVLLNARLSERSFRRWQRLPQFIGHLLQGFDLCLARTRADAERLTQLGGRKVVVSGNLKLDVPAPPADAPALAALQDAVGSRPVMAAASTHPGEDELVIAAHKRLRADMPGLLTLIAPRHPERGPQIAALASAAGLTAAVRSESALPNAATDIYVADTMGELGLLYRLTPVVFIGGSLIPHGGQNPIEAAKLGTAIVHGPHVANFQELYAELDAANGAELVADGDRLAATLGALLTQPILRERMARAGHDVVEALGGALERTMQGLEPYLDPLQHRQGAHHA